MSQSELFPNVPCPRCYAPAGKPCFDMRHDWSCWTEKGIAQLKAGWRPSYVRTKSMPHRERREERGRMNDDGFVAVQTFVSFDGLAAEIHQWTRGKGFYDRERLVVRDPVTGDVEGRPENPSMPAEKLMLIVSECAEILEALRDGDRENEAEELADVVIRCLDYAGWRGISLDREIGKKMEHNRVRPHLHGRSF